MSTTITHDQMQHLYYDINPNPHSEKAYQVPPDSSAPIAPKRTVADSAGKVTVLVTTVYNRESYAGRKYGDTAEFAVHTSSSGAEVCRGSGRIPFRADLKLTPGGSYWIQPLTPNTMAKLLPTDKAV